MTTTNTNNASTNPSRLSVYRVYGFEPSGYSSAVEVDLPHYYTEETYPKGQVLLENEINPAWEDGIFLSDGVTFREITEEDAAYLFEVCYKTKLDEEMARLFEESDGREYSRDDFTEVIPLIEQAGLGLTGNIICKDISDNWWTVVSTDGEPKRNCLRERLEDGQYIISVGGYKEIHCTRQRAQEVEKLWRRNGATVYTAW